MDSPHYFFKGVPLLMETMEYLKRIVASDTTYRIILHHLQDPTMPALQLAQTTQSDERAVRAAYLFMQQDAAVRNLVVSLYYSRRWIYEFARNTVMAWIDDPDFLSNIVNGEPVFSRVLEIHPSKGTCDYSCAMCLWSDKNFLTYSKKGLDINGLMTVEDWHRVLASARALGTRTLVISGGGEVFLNNQIVDILRISRALNFSVHIYTNGFSLATDKQELLDEVLRVDQIRFSIHSPLDETYNKITGLPTHHQALRVVSQRIRTLLSLRVGNHPKIGMGFVLQPLNHAQVVQMASFAVQLGVDFLNLRKDEVFVTESLNPKQLELVMHQLQAVRAKSLNGSYLNTIVDMSDELVSLANGQPFNRFRVHECYAKYFRPTISPYGSFAPCDLKAEPRFANDEFSLGSVRVDSLFDIYTALPNKFIADACQCCMPSSRTGNAVYTKLILDHQAGLGLKEQPFYLGK